MERGAAPTGRAQVRDEHVHREAAAGRVQSGPPHRQGRGERHGPPPPPATVEGTYRTEGQVLVITRFLEAVADSFRSNINVRQHVIFAGCRDSGHLAELATARWPPRGSHRTQFHVIADDLAPDDSERALGYGTLDGIEERFRNFRGSEHVHLYDREGNVAGGKAGGGTDDLIYKDDDDGAGGGGGGGGSKGGGSRARGSWRKSAKPLSRLTIISSRAARSAVRSC